MKLKNCLADWKELILEQFFPVTCPFCGRVISFRLSCCEACKTNLNFLENACGRCRKKSCICEHIQVLGKIYAPFAYDGAVERAIQHFKFQNHPEYAKTLAEYIAKCFGTNQLGENYDCLVPVPMDRAHKRERGYNQAEELAAALGRFCGLPVLNDALRKVRKTPPQHLLSYEERLKNLEGAFEIGKNPVEGKRILLCDDVYTTGTTLEACAAVLKENGAVSVDGAVAASVQ